MTLVAPERGLAAVLREWAGSYEEGSFDTEEMLMRDAADELDARNARIEELTHELTKRPDWKTVDITYEKWKSRAEAAEGRIVVLEKELEATKSKYTPDAPRPMYDSWGQLVGCYP